MNHLYAQVSNSLMSRIESGLYWIGEHLSSERLLSQEFQVRARRSGKRCFPLELTGLVAHAADMLPSVAEHEHILDAISSGKPALARVAMHKHLTRVLDPIMHETEFEQVNYIYIPASAASR